LRKGVIEFIPHAFQKLPGSRAGYGIH
jgi:hypothetical protein